MSDPVQFITEPFEAEQGWRGEGWYFWDETWSHAHGPFDSAIYARFQLEQYARLLAIPKPRQCSHCGKITDHRSMEDHYDYHDNRWLCICGGAFLEYRKDWLIEECTRLRVITRMYDAHNSTSVEAEIASLLRSHEPFDKMTLEQLEAEYTSAKEAAEEITG